MWRRVGPSGSCSPLTRRPAAAWAQWLVDHHPEVLEGCTEAVGEVGGFSLTVRDDLRLYPIQTAEKGLVWMDLIADGRAGHGSFHNDENAITDLAAAVARVGTYEWPHKITGAQRAFLEAVCEAFDIDLDPDRARETLARLGSIERMMLATMSNTVNPTMLRAGYKHNVIPSRAFAGIDGRFIPGGRDEFMATIADLIGDRVRYEVAVEQPAVETEFSGALVEAMQTCLVAEDPGARAVPYLMSGGTDARRGTGSAFAASASRRCDCRTTLISSTCSTVSTSGCRFPRWSSAPGCSTGSWPSHEAQLRWSPMSSVRGVEYEVERVRLGRHLSGRAVRQLLTDHAEYGGWELTRIRRYRDGTRDVWIRRKIIRVPASV